MALSLILFSFSKRQNSTAIPADASGVAVEVTLKNETSLNQPVFLLSGNRPNYSYAKFDGAYYFIDDIRSVRNGLYELVCSLDVLGTYRNEIGATNAFVEYASNGNSQIPDTRLDVEYGVAGVNVTSGGSAIPYLSATLNDVGRFITVIGQSRTETFFISAAALESLFDEVATWSGNTIDASSLETILTTGLQQLIGSGSAADCVRDAYCLPIVSPLSVLDSAHSIWLGMFNTHIQANKIVGAGLCTDTITINIPHQYSDWRKQAPYEVCQLFLPLYGTLNIPSDIAADSSALTITGMLNVRSGDFTYYIAGSGRAGEHEITVGGNCSAPLAVGASNINPMKAVGAGGALATLAFGNIGAVGSALNMLSPVPSAAGQSGGISNRYVHTECYIYYRNTSAEPGSIAASQGIPVMAQRTLSTLSGYVQTRGASVSGNIRGALRDQINEMLNAGFFME